MEEKIKDYFERYPKNDEVFENGGILFHTKGAADSYGKTDTTKHNRNGEIVEELTAEQKEAAEKEAAEKEAAEKEAAEKEAAEAVKAEIEKFKIADVATLDYNEMKRLVSLFKLAAEDNKKETLTAVLESFKNGLNKPE